MNFIAIIMTPDRNLEKVLAKTISPIYSNVPYFRLCDFAESNWNHRYKQCFDGSTY